MVNMPNESQRRTFYLIVTVMSALSVTVYEILSRNCHDLDLDLDI